MGLLTVHVIVLMFPAEPVLGSSLAVRLLDAVCCRAIANMWAAAPQPRTNVATKDEFGKAERKQ